jgi:hypothetical protein
MLGVNVMPCLKSHMHAGKGSNPRWVVELHPLLVRTVRNAVDQGRTTSVDAKATRKLTSRLSIVLWSRWLAVLDGAFPMAEIDFGKEPNSAAMDFSIPIDAIPRFMGHYGKIPMSVVNRLMLTALPRSPIKKELLGAGVARDIVRVNRAGYGDQFGIEIQMTTLSHEGLAYLTMRQRHQELRMAKPAQALAAQTTSAHVSVSC